MVASGHASVADSGQTTSAKDSKPHSGSNDVQIALEAANAELYKTVHVERCKAQRATARKVLLEGQIKLLQSVELPTARGYAARAIQLLKKSETENVHLTHELSKLLERCTLEASRTKAVQAEYEAKQAVTKREC